MPNMLRTNGDWRWRNDGGSSPSDGIKHHDTFRHQAGRNALKGVHDLTNVLKLSIALSPIKHFSLTRLVSHRKTHNKYGGVVGRDAGHERRNYLRTTSCGVIESAGGLGTSPALDTCSAAIERCPRTSPPYPPNVAL